MTGTLVCQCGHPASKHVERVVFGQGEAETNDACIECGCETFRLMANWMLEQQRGFNVLELRCKHDEPIALRMPLKRGGIVLFGTSIYLGEWFYGSFPCGCKRAWCKGKLPEDTDAIDPPVDMSIRFRFLEVSV